MIMSCEFRGKKYIGRFVKVSCWYLLTCYQSLKFEKEPVFQAVGYL
jgi:hypothetical protein